MKRAHNKKHTTNAALRKSKLPAFTAADAALAANRPIKPSPAEHANEIALRYLRAGIAVIALALDGTKRPLQKWKPYQDVRPTVLEIRAMFAGDAGIALVCGEVSGGLEVLDFDDIAIYHLWTQSIDPALLNRLTIVGTGGGGRHVLYRCIEICGNTKIAKRRVDGRLVATAETRGQGGYAIAVGSDPSVHQSGDPYVQLSGPPLPEITTITPEERQHLWLAAAALNEVPDQAPKPKRRKSRRLPHAHATPQSAGDTPWDWFDRHGCWAELLEDHDWTTQDGIRWSRPGKACELGGHSAVINVNDEGVEILTVFSTNAGELAPDDTYASYGPFRAYAILEHGGDYREAARAIRDMMRAWGAC